MEKKPHNQGEGDVESAQRYNENTQAFVESGKVDEAARKAGDGDKQEMERAEQAGRDRAKEFDPAVNRDYSNPKR